jgi:hypothetical protein
MANLLHASRRRTPRAAPQPHFQPHFSNKITSVAIDFHHHFPNLITSLNTL